MKVGRSPFAAGGNRCRMGPAAGNGGSWTGGGQGGGSAGARRRRFVGRSAGWRGLSPRYLTALSLLLRTVVLPFLRTTVLLPAGSAGPPDGEMWL